MVTIIVFNLLLLLILPPFIEQFQSLLNNISQVNEKINDLINWINNSEYEYFRFVQNLRTFIDNYSFVPDNLVDNFIAFFSNIVLIISQLIFVFVLTIVLLANPLQYRYYFRQLFPSFYRT